METEGAPGNQMSVKGREFGTVTGRKRRCGWFDLAALKRSIIINGVSGLCITKLDVLDGLTELVALHWLYARRAARRPVADGGADESPAGTDLRNDGKRLSGTTLRCADLGRASPEARAPICIASRRSA